MTGWVRETGYLLRRILEPSWTVRFEQFWHFFQRKFHKRGSKFYGLFKNRTFLIHFLVVIAEIKKLFCFEIRVVINSQITARIKWSIKITAIDKIVARISNGGKNTSQFLFALAVGHFSPVLTATTTTTNGMCDRKSHDWRDSLPNHTRSDRSHSKSHFLAFNRHLCHVPAASVFISVRHYTLSNPQTEHLPLPLHSFLCSFIPPKV